MSEYTNAQYLKNPLTGTVDGISVDIDGVLWVVPIDPENTDYANMMVLVAEGKLVIAPAD
jgi:sugar lactone lactonase YvrE